MRAFPRYPGCPVCGDPSVNPGALDVVWFWDEERRGVCGSFVPDGRHTGYEGRMHGGLLSSLLDEAMAWACAVERRTYCVTGELKVRFKTAARVGERVELTARVAEGGSWGPYLRAEGEARGPGGRLVGSAVATFATLPREEALRMRKALRITPGDLDVLAE